MAVVAAPGDEPPGLDAVRELASVQLATSGDELSAAFETADVLLVLDFQAGYLRETWPLAQRIRWVHTASAGVDAIAFPELATSAVTATHAPGVFDGPMAEFVLGAMLVFTKDLHTSLALQREARWGHRETQRLAGTRALVIGAGGVGRAVARLLRAVDVEVEVMARTARHDHELGGIRAIDDLDHLLGRLDWVVLAVALTDETHALIDRARLARMKPSARLVNVARGAIVDEGALLDALRSGRVAGAALDVFQQEPLPADHPFWTRDDVLVSPHMSGDAVGWREALMEGFVANLRRWLDGEQLHDVVDLATYVHSGGGASGAET